MNSNFRIYRGDILGITMSSADSENVPLLENNQLNNSNGIQGMLRKHSRKVDFFTVFICAFIFGFLVGYWSSNVDCEGIAK